MTVRFSSDCPLWANVVQMGSVSWQSLDPFQDIDPLDTFSEISESLLLFAEAGHGDDVNERYDSDREEEYVPDEEQNAFDAFMDHTPPNM